MNAIVGGPSSDTSGPLNGAGVAGKPKAKPAASLDKTRLGKIAEELKYKTGKELTEALSTLAQPETKKDFLAIASKIYDEMKKMGKSDEEIRKHITTVCCRKGIASHHYKGLPFFDPDGTACLLLADKAGRIPNGWSDPYLRASQQMLAIQEQEKKGRQTHKQAQFKKVLEKTLEKERKKLEGENNREKRFIYEYKILLLKKQYATKFALGDPLKIQSIIDKKLSKKFMDDEEIKKKFREEHIIAAVSFVAPGGELEGAVMFDTGGVSGVERGDGKNLEKDSLKVDHHGETEQAPSAAGMVQDLLKKRGYELPAEEKRAYEAYRHFMDAYDNMGYEIQAARIQQGNHDCDSLFSLAPFAPEYLIDFFKEYPDASGFDALPYKFLEKKTYYNGKILSLAEISKKLQNKLEKTIEAVRTHHENTRYIEKNGEKYLVILPTDSPLNSAEFSYKIGAALAMGYNVLNLFPEDQAKAEKASKKGKQTKLKGAYVYSVKDLKRKDIPAEAKIIRDHIVLLDSPEKLGSWIDMAEETPIAAEIKSLLPSLPGEKAPQEDGGEIKSKPQELNEKQKEGKPADNEGKSDLPKKTEQKALQREQTRGEETKKESPVVPPLHKEKKSRRGGIKSRFKKLRS